MESNWTNLIVVNHYGDWASIFGVLISLFGFWITIVGVTRARSAARRAEQAARDTRKSIKLLDSVAEFATAITMIDEIKRLNRESAWRVIPDRFSALKRVLVNIRSGEPRLTDDQRRTIQKAVQDLADLESLVERAIESTKDSSEILDVPRINRVISGHADRLSEIVINLRDRVSESDGNE